MKPLMHNGKWQSQSQTGFTYIGMLIFVVIMGITQAALGTMYSQVSQRDKEQRLLLIGERFRTAIGYYYEQSPGPKKTFPQTLEQLLRDERFTQTKRYLRQIYPDPISGERNWGLIKVDGTIRGVYSLAPGEPKKTANFSNQQQDFLNSSSYDQWRFIYTPKKIQRKDFKYQPLSTEARNDD